MRRPLFQAVAVDAPDTMDDEDDEPIREAPDRSHVTPPPAELPAVRDEALEELSRRLDVFAARADRLERSVESLSPVHIADMPTRPELRAIESLANSNRDRAEAFERRLTEIRDTEVVAAHARASDRATVTELAETVARLQGRVRDLAEEVQEARSARETLAESLREAREAMSHRDAAREADIARRLAGAYTVALVALLAAIVTLVLLLTK